MWTVFSPCSALDMLLMLFVFSSYVGIVWLYVGHVILFSLSTRQKDSCSNKFFIILGKSFSWMQILLPNSNHV